MINLPPLSIDEMISSALSDEVIKVACPLCLGMGCSGCEQRGYVFTLIHCDECGQINWESRITCLRCGNDLRF